MTVTTDWTAEYRDLSIGGDSDACALVRVDGLLDLPQMRTADLALLVRDGVVPGTDRMGGRTVRLTVEVAASTAATFVDAIADLATATTFSRDTEYPFVFQIPGVAGGSPAVIYARPRARALPQTMEYLYRIPTAMVELFASDPLIYSNSETVATLNLAQDPGGLEFDLVFDAVFGGGGSYGSTTVTNSGTATSPVMIRINGPVTNPTVRNVTTSQSLAFTAVLATGDYLEVDTTARTVLLNGTADRYSYLTTPQWWGLQPGANEVRYFADVTTASTATVTYRSAWI